MTDHTFNTQRILDFFKSGGSNRDMEYIREIFTDPAHEKELKKLLSEQFSELPRTDSELDHNLESVLHKIHYEINLKRPAVRKRRIPAVSWISGVAAGLLLLLAIGWGIRTQKMVALNRETWVEVNSPAWTRTRFSLPDGTTGWLNTRSVIRYTGNFLNDRKIMLSGEAFFDVKSDKRHPFRVSAGDVTATVLGTRFNIASYEDESSTEVVLEEGLLEMTTTKGSAPITIRPEERISYAKESGKITRDKVLPQKYIAWTEGKLVFRNDPLDVIARQLERWYNIDVVLDVANPADFRWRATFADESLEEVLKLLKRSLQVDYRIESRKISPDNTVPPKKVFLTSKNQ
jgi:ferric-dicitrate binding protein FerR (iron transport regulator)